MSLLPKDLENMLGTKEEFEEAEMRRKIDSLPSSLEIDEDGDDLLGEKLKQEYQDEMRADLEEILN